MYPVTKTTGNVSTSNHDNIPALTTDINTQLLTKTLQYPDQRYNDRKQALPNTTPVFEGKKPGHVYCYTVMAVGNRQ